VPGAVRHDGNLQEPDNSKIFYTNINIAERIRRDHPLPKIAARVDFDFTYRVVADNKYGTIENFLACYDKGIRAHMPDLSRSSSVREEKRGIYPETHFRYDRKRDIYICPAGQELRFKSIHHERQSKDYGARKKDCKNCELPSRCTSNKMGRTVKRHYRQEDLDVILEQSRSDASRKDILCGTEHPGAAKAGRQARKGSGSDSPDL